MKLGYTLTTALLLGASAVAISAPALAAPGAIAWTTTTGGAVDSSPTVERGTVYVGSDDAKVYALDARRARSED